MLIASRPAPSCPFGKRQNRRQNGLVFRGTSKVSGLNSANAGRSTPKQPEANSENVLPGLTQSVGFVPFEQVSTRPAGQIHGRRTTEIKIWFLGQGALYRSIR
jgi:hypothetical protein